jgi:hypothetical protein
MPSTRPSSQWADELAHELHTAMTIAKTRAQLIRRVPWPTTESAHERMLVHAVGIDAAINTAGHQLARLLAEHARRWPDEPEASGGDDLR